MKKYFIFGTVFLISSVIFLTSSVLAQTVDVPTTTDQSVIVDTSTTTDATTTTTDATATLPTEVIATDTATATVSNIPEPTTSPTLTTDQADYHPGQTASIFGNFFQPLQNIILKIFGSDDNDQNYTESNQTIKTDESGHFSFLYNIDTLYRPFYEMTASSLDGSLLAHSFFRDSAIGTYDQCSNDLGTGYSTGDTGCRWTNGNLQSSNSVYQEGDSTVQRLWIKGYAPGSTHTVTFQYGTTKSGKHAYDFLTTWDASENWITVDDRCQDITGCTTATETSLPIPHDPNGSGQFETGTRNFVMRGGTLDSATIPSIVSGTYAGDSETAITISFTVDPNGAMCSTKSGVTSCGISIWFGAHIAKGAQWTAFDGSTGAGSIPGSPYHVALAAEDGTSVGQRDNQMQAGAIIAASTITIHKVTSPNASDPTVFTFGTTGTGYTGFTLTGGNQNQQSITGTGSYSVAETVPTSWDNTGLTCTASGSGSSATPTLGTHSVAITIGSGGGATIDCVYTNTLQLSHLVVQKTTIPGADPTIFSINATGTGAITGGGAGSVTDSTDQIYEMTAGTYAVTEASTTGWTQTSNNCTGVVVTAGATSTCQIVNTKKGSITIIKNTTGGDRTFDFTTTGGGGLPATTTLTTVSGTASTTFPNITPGSYSISEVVPAGWDLTSSTCTSGSPASFTVPAGGNVTCTFNNIQKASLIVIKHVINNNGGTATSSDFTIHVTGTNVSSSTFPGADSPGTTVTLNAGSYSATEDAVTGYAASTSTDCVGTITAGQTKTCTITNDDIAPKLTVIKQVINDNGGTSTPSSFTINVTGTNVSSPTFPGNASGTMVTLDQGSYNVSEIGLPGYASSTSTDCSGTVNVGENKTCTIVNNDQPGHLIVHKVTDPSSDTTTQFSITASGGTIVSPTSTQMITGGGQVDYTVNAGTYNVGEAPLLDWSSTGNTCVNVFVANGGSASCTITNTKLSHLVVHKIVINHGLTNDASHFAPYNVDGSPVTLDATITVSAGSHTVTETTDPSYTASFSDNCNSSGVVTVATGTTAVCTITNEEIRTHLTVNKILLPSSDTGLFNLEINGGTYATNTGNGGTTGSVVVNSGTSTVGELAGTGTNLSDYLSVISGDCAANGTIHLAPGASSTCTITNTRKASLTIVKDAQPNDLIDFAFSGNNGLGTFSLDDDAGVIGGDNTLPASTTFSGLTPQSYTITETEPNAFWALSSVSCVVTGTATPYNSSLVGTALSLNLTPGVDVTCTFVNTKLGGATRTLGFWQTHTSFTSGVFAAAPISSNMPIGTTPHKGFITTAAQLFGAFYAPIAKTSTGTKRSPIDQARIQLLQQLVAAKLNCAAFGCSGTITTLIATADADYAAGTKAAILADASALDAFNNSGDTIIFSPPLPAPGNATPADSKSLANLTFWDNP